MAIGSKNTGEFVNARKSLQELSEAMQKAQERLRIPADHLDSIRRTLEGYQASSKQIAEALQANSAFLSSITSAQEALKTIDWSAISEQLNAIKNASTIDDINRIRSFVSGNNNPYKIALGEIKNLPVDSRKIVANTANTAVEISSSLLRAREEEVEEEETKRRLATETVDLSLPPPPRRRGVVHPTMQVLDEMIAIFAEMGFGLAEGPDIEDDFHNFTALNFPPKHPAREIHDTFWLAPDASGEKKVLRTHTSPVQIRTMQRLNEKVPAWVANGPPTANGEPPIRVIVPGRTYRSDSDATHTPMFHQMEGLVIDRAIHMGHLKWTVDQFIARYFETPMVETRFRPHHFPFTEPSAEMDVRCDRSGGDVKIGQGSDWMEIVGCGMVHPNVLKNCGLDPDEWQGFAFGFGIDRLGMLKYGMPDLRDMFASDVRWLEHYGFGAFQAPNPATGLS